MGTQKTLISKAMRLAFTASIAAALVSVNLYAADAKDDAKKKEVKKEEDNKVVVTGSRLKQETFTSIAPLQIITSEESLERGLVDSAAIIQGATASTGQQIDLTFSGFVLDNGPGASTANLRGLGSNRTLVLANGRRMAPSGVEGAPAAPDLNLIPAAMVDRYELLLDGASSIYGSDAVAGVVNVIYRKDFDGFEFNYFTDIPDQPNGTQQTLSGLWGKNFDRGFIGIGVEYTKQDEVKLRDRRWTNQCDRNVEVDELGNIRHQDLYYPTQGQRVDPRGCKPTSGLVGRVSVPFAGSIYYTPGFSNGGWGDFSESSQFGLSGIDSDGDGVADVSFVDYSLNGSDGRQAGSLFSRQERTSVLSYGEYTLEGDMNLTPYYEAQYNKRNFFTNSGAPQFFPFVPADNPYNLCNPNGVNGIDCGTAWDTLMNNPALVQQVLNTFGCDIRAGGSCDQTVGAIGAAQTRPIVAVRGDRNTTRTTMEQKRVVFGMRGDLPFEFGSVSDWTFDTYVSFTESIGKSSRLGIREDRLDQALDVVADPSNPGSFVCTDTSNGCVPVNLFAPSLYAGLVGDFATQAERDFLFDSRDFKTTYKQTVFSAFMSGSLLELPAGTVTTGFGVEYRKDQINSIPDDIARDGLFFGFFADGGAVGSKTTKEAYGEINIPLLAEEPFAKELVFNVSGRYTKDEFYGGNYTYSGKLGWRPIDSLLIRGTYGTSYRAPNVRENFLKAQTGFNTLFDPCQVPDDAINAITGQYDPAQDTREPQVFANCLANGVDATTFTGNGTGAYSTEISTGGVLGLNEETSTSRSYGFVWEQPFTDEFSLTTGMTYWTVSIDQTIVEPSGQFIINDCYLRVTLDSTFCDRITRDSNNELQLINAGFLNRDNATVRGIDVNVNFAETITMFGEPVNWAVNLVGTNTLENSTLFTDDNGAVTFNDTRGQFGQPKWKARLDIRANYDDWTARWSVNYIGQVEQDPAGIDPFDNINGISDTCLGPAEDVNCRDVGYAGNYKIHTASLSYRGDDWRVGFGVRNLFDRAPPLVDGSEVLAANNAPIGYGYDLNGRSFFFNVSKNIR